MSTLLERMMEVGELKKRVSLISDSEFFNEKDFTHTGYPSIDIAFSGSLTGGITSGLTVLAGHSKTFKCVGGDTKLVVYKLKSK